MDNDCAKTHCGHLILLHVHKLRILALRIFCYTHVTYVHCLSYGWFVL